MPDKKKNGRELKIPELGKKEYEGELRKLQTKLVEMQEWVTAARAKVVVVFEGRDAAGKGGVIHRIMERVSPRIFRHVALPAPTEREKSQLYMQRYLREMPAGGHCLRPQLVQPRPAEHAMVFARTSNMPTFRLCPTNRSSRTTSSLLIGLRSVERTA